jgi:energy-coupling factor transporter ATP-binding protein EcfA2
MGDGLIIEPNASGGVMFLRRIVIDNVRSVKHLDLNLAAGGGDGRQWTFLLGENGTGKSTILRSIALVLAGSDALPELLGNAGDWVRFKAREARIRAELMTADGEPRSAEIVITPQDTIRNVFERNGRSLADLEQAVAHSSRNYFTVGYGVSRRPSDEKSSVIQSTSLFTHPRARTMATLFSPHASLVSLETWAMDLDYRGKAGFASVRKTMNRLLPGLTLKRIDREKRELIFGTPDGEMPYRLLSEGYQNVAAWTGDLLYQITNVFEDYADPFSARGLLLIDEIDLHLHPTWQRQLMQFVGTRFPNLQIIATTHSPLTVHQAGEGELFFLRRPTPRAPAQLIAYEGAPRDLMLHQLLTSPLFGLTSLDSRPVEKKKAEYRQLRDARARSESDGSRMRELADELADTPDWGEGIDGQEELTKALRAVEKQLSKR